VPSALEDARALLKAGRFLEAGQLTRKLLVLAPQDMHLWKLMGSIQLASGQLECAVVSLERVLRDGSATAADIIILGQCLARLGRRREALTLAERAERMELGDANLHDGLGTLLSYCDEPARALPQFAQAVGITPDNEGFRFNLATAQRMVGDLIAAEDSLNRVIAAKPNDFHAHLTRSDLRVQTPARNHIDQMQKIIGTGLPGRSGEITMCFALAKELEDIGEYSRSFDYLKRGCDLQRAAMSYDVQADVSTIDRIIARHDASIFDNPSRGHDNDECIFVVGLPRSGTTLVEQIVSSHPDIQAAGELPAFAYEAVRAVQSTAHAPVPKLEFVDRVLQIPPRELGERYIAETRPQTGRSQRFVDKAPLNYLYLGLIHRALPRARIILVMREPMDSCYAMYKTLFTAAYPFSYDLNDLGRYYCAWLRLTHHWQSVLGDSLLVVQYEDLIANQESVTRRMIEHCRVPWDNACMKFHEQSRAISTASAAQARRPLYATSVGKWRHYSEQLAALAHHVDSLRRS
jgi:tetratricopeptide (TPR) repeat protein